RILSQGFALLTLFRVAEVGEENVIELQVAATDGVIGGHRVLIGLDDVGEENLGILVCGRSDIGGIGTEVQTGWAGDGNLRADLGVLLHEAEMTQHGMILREAELAVDDRMKRWQRGAVELHTLTAEFQVHAVEHSHEVEMPVGAASFAVRDNL